MTDDDTTPGWDAIDAALARVYPGVEPLHYGTLIKFMLGGPDPLDGISLYRREDHWHLIGYGMSELYTKEWEDPAESGWGFEFTIRVAAAPGDDEPPVWAASLLQNLARYVFASGNPFGPGHHMNLNGPISLARPDTAIRAVAFADDPELGVIDTPHGRVRFLQVVGLTLEEYEAVERWDTERLLGVLRGRLPLLVTDLDRADLTGDPEVAAAIAEGSRREGSSTGALFVADAGWRADGATTTLRFGANAAPRLGRVLTARLAHGRDLIVGGPDGTVIFRPADAFATAGLDDGTLEVRLPAALAAELADVLRPVAGTYPLATAPALAVQIMRSQIRDTDGNVVAEIG
ncbi:suppressor of fused domain protein [Catellatospora sp. NPDC049609]|uniref:suppressor of fused domain protein n=1 Tax=Catellatospora sp. NPDC049609 TaxID=3155505 RepID=UPI00344896E3